MNDQPKQALIGGNAATVTALTEALLASGAGAREILDEALLPGMEVVGQRMREGECFVPEVLLSARTMQGALDLIRPHMLAGESTSAGCVVIGTVEGDLHEIGKNLVAMLLQGPASRWSTAAPGWAPPPSSKRQESTRRASSA